MSYKTCPFKSVFERVVRATGVPVIVISELSADQQETFVEDINEALKAFWIRPGHDFWPGTFAIEQRTIDATDKYILKQASGETEIGEIDPDECFFEELPEPGSLYGVLGKVEDRGDRIVCFDEDCPTQPYIRFQLPCPQFTRVAYDEDNVYAEGELVYDADSGECYKSLQDGNTGQVLTNTTWWQQVEFPAMAREYVRLAASTMHISEDDGRYKQQTAASRELENMESSLPPRRVAR